MNNRKFIGISLLIFAGLLCIICMGVILPFVISGTDFPGWGILIALLSFLIIVGMGVFILGSTACHLITNKKSEEIIKK